ncbi:MAG: hypothetical protein H0U17_04750 [Actinobacteria bacterium]|nr:hypothetical protein [Actinomycetota bacterium]
MRLAGILGVFLVFVLAAGAATLLFTRTASDPTRERGVPVVRGIEASGPRYESIRELVAASDLILTGTVEEVLAGEIEGPPGEEIEHVNTVVSVHDVWRGSMSDATVTVETLKQAFGGPAIEEWREPEQEVLLFLSRSTEPETAGLYILAKTDYSQTAYTLFGDDVRTTASDSLGDLISKLTRPELRERVRENP